MLVRAHKYNAILISAIGLLIIIKMIIISLFSHNFFIRDKPIITAMIHEDF